MVAAQVLRRMILRYALLRRINAFAAGVVMLSVACLFTVNAVLKGIEAEWEGMIRGSRADVQAEWSDATPDELARLLPPSITWAPSLKSFGLLRSARFITAVTLKGVDPGREEGLRRAMGLPDMKLSRLDEKPEAAGPAAGLMDLFGSDGGGEEEDGPAGGWPLLVGEALAEDVGLAEGDALRISAPDGAGGIGSAAFTVRGVFRSGFYEDDRGLVVMPLLAARALLRHPTGVSQVQATGCGGDVAALKAAVAAALPGSPVRAWYEAEPVSLRALRNQRVLVALILSLIVVVSGFAILAIQWNFVREKFPDIGILRALGFRGREIFAVFLGVSWLVGLVGLALGLAGGVALSHWADALVRLTGWDPFPSDIYYHQKLPAKIEFLDMLWISGLGLAVTTLAGLLPAWNALRIRPIEAIRKT